MKSNIIIVLIVLFVSYIFKDLFTEKVDTRTKKSKHIKLNEKYYQNRLCSRLNGVTEYRLKDATRVDCLTNKYAIEVDWAKKWAEGIGQALYYGLMTGKKPAVALIVGRRDKRYLRRLRKVTRKFNIKIFLIDKIK